MATESEDTQQQPTATTYSHHPALEKYWHIQTEVPNMKQNREPLMPQHDDDDSDRLLWGKQIHNNFLGIDTLYIIY